MGVEGRFSPAGVPPKPTQRCRIQALCQRRWHLFEFISPGSGKSQKSTKKKDGNDRADDHGTVGD
jgi:hypothetical protein